MGRISAGVLTGVGLVLVVGLGVTTIRTLPDYAVVLVDDNKKTYAAPHCYLETGRRIPAGARFIPYSEITGQGYEPEDLCVNRGYLVDEPVSILRDSLERVGVLPRRPTRWNEDGSWNW